MTTRHSKLDTREPQWWTSLFSWCDRYGIQHESAAYEDLFEIVLEAIYECKAAELGHLGGPVSYTHLTLPTICSV